MLPDFQGLSKIEASERLKKFGRNTLPEKPPPSDLLIFASQLKNPLVYVLLFAMAVSLILRHLSDALIISIAVLINTILGFVQERKATKALYALKKLVPQYAEVIRDGLHQKIDATDIVPGDHVALSPGTKVTADGKMVFANRLYIDESLLTGESVPLSKDEGEQVYMGTVVSSGQGLFEVTATGSSTKMGQIAAIVQVEKEDSVLKKQLVKLSNDLIYIISGLAVFIVFIGLLTGRGMFEIFTTAIALAVSAIPEGLPISLTVVLAIGMQRILKRKGLVRNLVSAETLGGVTTICVDKTGTLTEGKMQVEEVVGDEQEIAKQMILANDLDDPLVIVAHEWAGRNLLGKNAVSLKRTRIDSLPFSSKERFFASLNQLSNEKILFVNGAPDILLDWSNVNDSQQREIEEEIERLTNVGRRVIGLARKEMPLGKQRIEIEDVKGNLEWVGLIAFTDPVRSSVKSALDKTKNAGIRTVVVTGDYPGTAKAVLAEIGIKINSRQIVLGEQLEKMTAPELSTKVKDIILFARTTPDQKLKIVEAFKANGEVVAMMGDGVNDAPALKMADIGIVVGEATDVAKETADLVILDSDFATIVASVEEGRGIFDNLRKIILYLLSDAFGEIITVIGALIAGFPLPITAVQILWINLVSDGFPDLALTIDRKRSNIMNERPRDPAEPLVNSWVKVFIAIVSLSSGIVALAFFSYVWKTTGDIILARSVTFVTLGINSLVYVFSVRTLLTPFWKANVFENKWLVVAVLAGFGLQTMPFVSSPMRQFFGTSLMPGTYWLIAFALSVLMFIMVELTKFFYRKSL